MYKTKYDGELKGFVKALNKLTDTELGYLAGIVDGEGSLGLYLAESKW